MVGDSCGEILIIFANLEIETLCAEHSVRCSIIAAGNIEFPNCLVPIMSFRICLRLIFCLKADTDKDKSCIVRMET